MAQSHKKKAKKPKGTPPRKGGATVETVKGKGAK